MINYSVDPDEMLFFAGSHLGLHCLLTSHFMNIRPEWI